MTNRVFTPAFLAAAFICAFPSFAAAKQRIALRLDYEPEQASASSASMEECPDAEQLGLMISAEFGYPVIRSDASAQLSVRVQRGPKGLAATLRAPSPTQQGAFWERKTSTQGTCQELAYDIAMLVHLGLGPSAWLSAEPPSVLAPPPEIEVGSVEIRPRPPRLPESLATVVPQGATPSRPLEPTTIGGTPVTAEVSFSANVMPYGLPGFAIGGAGMVQIRLPKVGFGVEFRGATMPTRGFGTPELDARASVSTVTFQPCLLSEYLDVCGVLGPSVMTFDAPPPIVLRFADGLSMGFGGRLVGRYPLSKRFTFYAYGDGTFQIRLISVRGLDPEDPTAVVNYWRSPSVRLTFGAGVAFSMFE